MRTQCKKIPPKTARKGGPPNNRSRDCEIRRGPQCVLTGGCAGEVVLQRSLPHEHSETVNQHRASKCGFRGAQLHSHKAKGAPLACQNAERSRGSPMAPLIVSLWIPIPTMNITFPAQFLAHFMTYHVLLYLRIPITI